MALFRKFFYRKPPEGLLEITERVFVFDCCFTTDVVEDTEYQLYIGGILEKLHGHFPDASFVVFNFGHGNHQGEIANILSEYNMTVIDYPCQYENCPLLSMEMIHHFLKSSESWLSLGQRNILLLHCQNGTLPVLAFVLAALLIYKKQYTGERKTLDIIYQQAPRELLQSLSPLNPLPSQVRYLQYVSRRNVGSEWPPLDRALTLDCVILRVTPDMDGQGGCRPIFRIYGPDPFMAADRRTKVLFSMPKESTTVWCLKQADCDLVKIDINCHVQGDVVLECITLDDSLEHEEMMFRVMFNTAFIRSNILILTRDEIDVLWNVKDRFPEDFRAEVLFSEMDSSSSFIGLDLPGIEDNGGLPIEAFAKIQDIFSNLNWVDPKADVALKMLQKASGILQEKPEITPSVSARNENMQNVVPFSMIKKIESTELQISVQRPTQSKIRSPVGLSRYHSAPSVLGITALLHDHAEFSSRDGTYPSESSTPAVVPCLLKPMQSFSSLVPPPEPLLSVSRSFITKPKASPPSTPQSPRILPANSSVLPLPEQLISGNQSINSNSKFTPPPPPPPPPFSQSKRSTLPSSITRPPPPPPPPPRQPSCQLSATEPSQSEQSISSSPHQSRIQPSLTEPQLLVPSTAPPTVPPPPFLPSKRSTLLSSITGPPPPPPPPPRQPSQSEQSISSPPHLSRVQSSPAEPQSLVPSREPPTEPPLPPPLHSDSYWLSENKGAIPAITPPPPSSGSIPVSTVRISAPPPPPPPSATQKAASVRCSQNVPPPPAPLLNGLTKTGGVSVQLHSSVSNGSIPAPPAAIKGKLQPRMSTRFLAHSKKTSLKPYHWLKLTRAMQGSIWAEAQKPEEASKAPELDMSELESLFSATVPKSDHGATSRKTNRHGTGLKSDKVQLIELRRAYNCEIMLTKVKVPLSDLMNSVLALDDSALDIDQVDNLIKFCPTKEEIEILTKYNGDKDNLGKCEKFFMGLMKVPRVESKLRVFSFKIQFGSQVSDLRNSLNIVNSASEEVRSSIKLKRIMQTILTLGNALNHGTARGSAVGFRLDSLLKLTETRARNNKLTLMHYLCKVLAEKLPEVLDFQKDLISLEAATKIQLKYLAEEMQSISKGLEKVVQELASSENDGSVSQHFCQTLKEFLGSAEAEVRSLASLYSGVGRKADALAFYFGEDPARCPFEQVVSTLQNFVKMFLRAHEENCKQLEIEKRKAQKEAENQTEKLHASEKKLENENMKESAPKISQEIVQTQR